MQPGLQLNRMDVPALAARRALGPGTVELDLHEIVGSLALALDLSEIYGRNGYRHHSNRVVYTAERIGRKLGLSQGSLDDLVLGGLLHDCGVTGERSFRQVYALDSTDTEPHCLQGASLLGKSSSLAYLSPIIRSHHDLFGRTNPSGLTGTEIPHSSRILKLADRVDVLIDAARHPLSQRGLIRDGILARPGIDFDPEVVDAWVEIANEEAYWFDLSADGERPAVREHRSTLVSIDLDGLEELASVFGGIVDSKSPSTHLHPTGVAAVVERLALALGQTEVVAKRAKVAGYLHDLGKLGVPAAVLDKPGPLLVRELDLVKRHAYETHRILSSIRGLEDIAHWASQHHEHVDGTGYPFHLKGDQLPLMSRAMCVADVFQALNQDRPYRRALLASDVKGLLVKMVCERHLDGEIVDLLLSDYSTYEQLARVGSPMPMAVASGT